jgi:hypothetical protein
MNINSTKHGPFTEADFRSGSQEIPFLARNPGLSPCLQKRPTVAHITSQVNLATILTKYLLSFTLIPSFTQHLALQSGFLSSGIASHFS